MIDSINVSMIRNLCDKAGFTTRISENGKFVLMVLPADEDFKRDVLVILGIDNGDLGCVAYPSLSIDQSQVGQILISLNECNAETRYIKASLRETGQIMFEWYVFIADESVSEEYLFKCIKMFPGHVWHACKKFLGNYCF